MIYLTGSSGSGLFLWPVLIPAVLLCIIDVSVSGTSVCASEAVFAACATSAFLLVLNVKQHELVISNTMLYYSLL